eukprot:1491920-Prymnesium_polylepis.1
MHHAERRAMRKGGVSPLRDWVREPFAEGVTASAVRRLSALPSAPLGRVEPSMPGGNGGSDRGRAQLTTIDAGLRLAAGRPRSGSWEN